MSSINVNTIKSRLGGPPTLPSGVVVSAAATFSTDVSIGGTLTYEDVTNVDAVGLITARNGIQFGAAGIGGTIRANGDTTLAGVVTATSFSGDGSALTGMASTENVSTSTLNVVGISTLMGNVGIGTTFAELKFHIQDGKLASAPTPNSNCDVVIEGTTNTGIQFLSATQTQLRFGDADSNAAGSIIYNHSADNYRLNYSNRDLYDKGFYNQLASRHVSQNNLENDNNEGFFEINYSDCKSIYFTKNILNEFEDNFGDGHPSISPDNKWIIYDSYPNKSRHSYLYLIENNKNITSKKIFVGKFLSPLKFNGYYRCDLHPRWSPDGKFISVDSVYTGKRKTYLIDVSKII